jgi:hypothetical protein
MALHHHPWLTKRKIISWKFFFNRFDTWYLEAQLSLQRAGELIEPRDLKVSHMPNKSFNKKLQKARKAITLSGATCLAALVRRLNSNREV